MTKMNHKLRKHFVLTILVTGAMIGLLLAFQLNTDFTVESNFPTEELEARQELFKNLLDEQSYLKSRIVSLREEIDGIQEEIDVSSQVFSLELLESLKGKVGLTEVTGAGVDITLDDSDFASRDGIEVADEELVQASDLRDIVNLLRAGHADAIAINNQRVLATSTISSVGTTILVNNTYVTPPFIISAVGDSELFLQRLLSADLLPELYNRKNDGSIVFEIVLNNRISIPIYNGNLKTDYLNLVE